jgi:hypothetical protein
MITLQEKIELGKKIVSRYMYGTDTYIIHTKPPFHIEPSRYATKLEKLDFYVKKLHDYVVRRFL